MKSKIVYSLILVVGLVFAGMSVNSISAQTPKKTETKDVIKYTCPMHPEVIKNKPGKCPKCGMTLVVKKENKSKKVENKKGDSKKKKSNSIKNMKM